MTRLFRALALVTIVAAAGCGGPYLIVETRNEAPAQVSVRPSHDALGNTLNREGPLIPIGPAPAEWEVPEALWGGKAYVEVVFADGSKRETFGVALPKDDDADDRKVLVTRPKGVR